MSFDNDYEYFELTEHHIQLIRQMGVYYREDCEFGAPTIDPKRPYGNSNVFGDIGKILGIEPLTWADGEYLYSDEQENDMLALHKETATALQVILSNGSFIKGRYKKRKYCGDWTLV